MKNNIHYIEAFIFFFILACFITYPLIFHMGSLVTGYGDELIIAWIQNWVIHIVTSGNIFSLFSANIYFPFYNSFAYSDQLITSSILSWVPLLIVRQPVVVVNFTLISSLTLLGFSLYSLAFYLTQDALSSALAGLLVIFSPALLDKTVHLQILSIQYVPFAILFFLLFLDKNQTRYLIASLIFFLLQTYNSFVPGYFIVFSYLIILLFTFCSNKNKLFKIATVRHIILFVCAFLFVIPIALPYYQVSHEYHYVRDIRDTIHFALQPEDFLNAGYTSRLHDLLLKIPVKQTSVYQEVKPGFIGGIFTILTLITLFIFIKRFRKNNIYVNLFSSIGLFGLILSLGPFLHINRVTIHYPFPIPLPYALFYYIIPGFKGIRDTERWEMLFVVAMAIAIAVLLHQFLMKFSFKKQLFIYCILFAGVISEFSFPMHFYSVPQADNFPKVYSWLASTPQKTKIIFFPIFNWNQFPYTEEELWRQYYSTIEFRPMVNGYTGFSPDPWQALLKTFWESFPSDPTIRTLKNLGLSYIIVDKSLYDHLYKDHQQKLSGQEVITILENNQKIKLMKVMGDEYVFAFR